MRYYNSTLKQIIVNGGINGGDKKSYVYRENGEVIEKTFRQVWEDEIAFGAYLRTVGFDGKKKIAILSENRYEWIVAYFTVLVGGNICVPLDPRLTASEIAEQLANCECDGIVVSAEYLETAKQAKEYPGVVLKEIFELTDFAEYIAKGNEQSDDVKQAFINYPVEPDDLACIVYTSGTTGKTKGVMLSHRNMAADALSCCNKNDGGHALSFLPLNHTYTWVSSHFAGLIKLEWGGLCNDISHLYKDIQYFSPQNFAAVPLAVEMIHQKIISKAKRKGNYNRMLDGIKFSENALKSGLDIRRDMFEEIHENLGGNLEFIMCGGAYLDPEIEKFMYLIGIQILTGYGLTECSPCVTVQTKREFKFGSAGTPIDCCEIKINDPDENGVGEIYVRGENVMVGYYGDEEATKSVFDGDWLKTGDLGYIDDEGYLFFKGRIKNLIIFSNGKNVSPEDIEDKLAAIEYVKEVLVYGENDRITAEFFLDTEAYPDCAANLEADVEKVNEQLGEYKRIQKIKTRDTEFPKTTTMKIIRKRD